MAWATASQTAATPRKIASKKRAIGPRPLRTARGAGRRAGAFFAVLFLEVDFRAGEEALLLDVRLVLRVAGFR